MLFLDWIPRCDAKNHWWQKGIYNLIAPNVNIKLADNQRLAAFSSIITLEGKTSGNCKWDSLGCN
ncbi:hypothetical protein Ctha_0309 [Chloroherpeton thalassium ATCC 35110]|uniref:Uncharacterized protein n=1 Tax=Chloroherpeton thalassium (strain ATCC 35110 / GB-78) TaxID=517418 RepID=B3QTY2_CHLT3|nr:hypothetical protein Ctha_0309 [Chloroherpeton thalassium ATCC 35110]